MIIYLDQNHWINLFQANQDKKDNKVLNEIKDLSQKDAVFPISLIHLVETLHSKQKCGEKLIDFMLDISKSYTIRQINSVINKEIEYFLKGKRNPTRDLKRDILKKGLPNVGGEWKIFDKKTGKEDKKAKAQIKSFLKSRQTFEMIGKDLKFQKLCREQKRKDKIPAYLENQRERMKESTHPKETIKKDRIIQNFSKEIMPKIEKEGKIISTLQEMMRTEFHNFFSFFPTFYTYYTLKLERDFCYKREIKKNDKYDILALSVAIPYSDIVVTEEFFQGRSMKANLNDIFNTDIIYNLDKLKYLI